MKYKLLALVLALAGILFLSMQVISLRNERARLTNNQEALLDTISIYKTESDKNAVSVRQLLLTQDEFKESNSKLLSQISDLNIKLKRVKSASSVSTSTTNEIKTEVRDSIVYKDSIIYKYQCINYSTPYLLLKGCITSPTQFEGIVKHYNSITRVEHRVPKKFLFFKFGTKYVGEEYLSDDPNTTITSVETVVIVDKEGNRK